MLEEFQNKITNKYFPKELAYLFLLSQEAPLLLLELVYFSLLGVPGSVERKRDSSLLIIRAVRLQVFVFTVFPPGAGS